MYTYITILESIETILESIETILESIEYGIVDILCPKRKRSEKNLESNPYHLGVFPPSQDASDHQQYYIFNRESL